MTEKCVELDVKLYRVYTLTYQLPPVTRITIYTIQQRVVMIIVIELMSVEREVI